MHVFVLLRFAFVLLESFHGSEPYCLFQLHPPWSRIFRLSFNVIAVVPATTYLVPLVIWVLVSFRRSDLAGLGGISASERTCSLRSEHATRRKKAKAS